MQPKLEEGTCGERRKALKASSVKRRDLALSGGRDAAAHVLSWRGSFLEELSAKPSPCLAELTKQMERREGESTDRLIDEGTSHASRPSLLLCRVGAAATCAAKADVLGKESTETSKVPFIQQCLAALLTTCQLA